MSSVVQHPLSNYLPKRPVGPMRSPARVLGWFSIGLGLAELAMPRALSRAAGMPSRPTLVRGYGLREIGVGAGLLLSRNPEPWLWARVAGDALDIATVGSGPLTGGRRPLRSLTSIAARRHRRHRCAMRKGGGTRIGKDSAARLQPALGIPQAHSADAWCSDTGFWGLISASRRPRRNH